MSSEKAFTCSQCGAPELERSGEGKLRCPYCGSLYSFAVRGPTVVIRKGANVIIGRKAKVTIRGGVEIQEGARVKVDGEVTLLERAPEEAISAARLRLRATGKDKA